MSDDDDVIQVYGGDGETDVQKRMRKLREAKKAKNDGLTHMDKFSPLNAQGKACSYCFFRCKIQVKGMTEAYTWTTEKNAAGYFVGWREVYRREKSRQWKTISKDAFYARRKRKDAKAVALKLWRRITAKRKGEPELVDTNNSP